MARDEELQREKKKQVTTYFNSLSDTTELGVKKFTQAYCMAKTAEKFFIRPKTVESYIYS